MRLAIVGAILFSASAALAQNVVSFDARDGRGRPFHFESTRGRVVALTFASRATQNDARKVNDELQKRASRDFTVVSIVDFRGIPSGAVTTAREKTAQSDRSGLKHVVDDDGSLSDQLGARPQQGVDIFVIDRGGRLVGRYDEDSLAQAEQQIDLLRKKRVSARRAQ
jgi:hypothetical protein